MVAECPRMAQNLKECNCSYGGCERKGRVVSSAESMVGPVQSVSSMTGATVPACMTFLDTHHGNCYPNNVQHDVI